MIDTYELDQYVQHRLADQEMSHAERARHAAAAIHVNVMTSEDLPIDTVLQVDEREFEITSQRFLTAHSILASHRWEDIEAYFFSVPIDPSLEVRDDMGMEE